MWLLAPWRLPDLLSRPWRLVRELDHIEDARCRRLLGVVRTPRLIGAGLGFLLAMVLGPLPLILLGGLLENMGRTGDIEDMRERGIVVLGSLVLVVVLLSVVFLPYLFLVRRALIRHTERARCPACRYGLMGLRIEDGAVLCPECGGRVVLEAIGMTAADVLCEERDAPVSAVRERSGMERFGRQCLKAAAAAMLWGALLWVVLDMKVFLAGGLFVMMGVGMVGLVVLALGSMEWGGSSFPPRSGDSL